MNANVIWNTYYTKCSFNELSIGLFAYASTHKFTYTSILMKKMLFEEHNVHIVVLVSSAYCYIHLFYTELYIHFLKVLI